MKLIRYILPSLALTMGLSVLTACSDDDFTETIFPDVPDTVDPSSATYKFDTWLNRNFRDIYNLQLFYKMRDVEADMNYNLVPARLDKAQDLAVLTKYLWFEAYKEVTGSTQFTQQYGPRILHLIGSSAHNPQSGTETLGLAEGGLKVSLFKVNEMDVSDVNMLNEYYFRTMHHEFGHILHQTKSYPTDFNLLSTKNYDAGSWSARDCGQVASLGFITPYASSEAREDFAETIANYLTRTDDQLDLIMWAAAQGFTTGVDKSSSDDDDPYKEYPYYCYYYYATPADRAADKKTYCLQLVDRPYVGVERICKVGFREGVKVTGSDADQGRFFSTVEETEAYIAEVSGRLADAQRDVESQQLYSKPYSELDDTEKAAVDRVIEEMTFMYPVTDTDGVNGLDIIKQKQTIVRTWFKDVWGIDFDELRKVVQKRQAEVQRPDGTSILDELRAEVEAIQ